jgi:predicted nuclease of restriction endonuclease-like (RecB) superfamily
MRNRKIESHNIHIDSDYIEWITELKQRYRSAQVKAVIKVNAEKLQFNWLLGRDLVRKKAEERWGSGVVEQLSLDMQRDFPDTDGFSVSNLWFMKKWYCFYTQKEAVQKLQRSVAELESEKLQQPVREFEKTKLHQAGAEMPAFFAGVPWGHHIAIITKCKSVNEALFYIKKTVEQGMSTSTCKGYLQVVHERAARAGREASPT